MTDSIQTDARAYVAVLTGPANGWGQHCCPVTGHQSHVLLRLLKDRHGDARFDAAVDTAFAYQRSHADTGETP